MNYNPTLHKLSNGITVILDPMDLETVSVKVAFNTGSRDELPSEKGLTHFCEHMLCKGTSRFPTQKQVNEYLDYYGGGKGASTGNDTLNFYGRIIADNINVLIDIIADQLQNSLFDTDKIETERTVVADELRRALDNPDRQLGDFISEKLFNYATFSTKNLGTFETIASFTREQMLDFLARRLSAKNCIIGISGKINDTDAVLQQLAKSFAFLGNHDVSENANIIYTPTVAHYTQQNRKNVKLRIGFPDIYEMTFENRFANMGLSKFERYMSDEIFNVIRRENGLVYGFGMTGTGNENFNLNIFATETAPENIERVVALIAKNAYKIYTENSITDEILTRFSRKNKLGGADWLESATARCDRLINFYKDFDRLYDFYETVKMSDSITREDVIKYSRGYFDGQMSVITCGPDFNADLKSVWIENFKN